MNPYYQDKRVTIYHGDCREVLPQLDVKVDLVLTDFPYGNGTDYGFYQDTKDNLRVLIDTTIPLILRMPIALIACGIGNMYSFPRPDWVLAWYWQHTHSGSSIWGFNNWQPILAYGKDPYLAAGLGRRQDAMKETSVASYQNQNLRHPCPKPIEVWEWLITRGSIKAGDLILDPFLGSGTTCFCAKKLNRYSIGIEIEEKYCEIAARRCCQDVMELVSV